MTSYVIRAGIILFSIASAFIMYFALTEYQGAKLFYVLFSICSFALLLNGFRRKAIIFDCFIGIYLWLGFWLKASVRFAFFDSKFREQTGNFSYMPDAFDRVLLIACCGFIALLAVSWVRQKYFYDYTTKDQTTELFGLKKIYTNHRRTIFVLSALFFLLIGLSNLYLGIYQRGNISRTHLPFGLNGVYTWLILFGLTSISTIILKFELLRKRANYYLVTVLCLFETFLTNVSLLSRGMIFNSGAIIYSSYRFSQSIKRKIDIRVVLFTGFVFVFLFISSVLTVNYLRLNHFYEAGYNDGRGNGKSRLEKTVSSINILFIDRWVGMEGLMAVSAYEKLDWKLWANAWQEKFDNKTTSFYDLNFIDTPYKNVDSTRNHFISLPGFIAFSFYPGSYIILFLFVFITGLGCSLIEWLAYKLSGANLIFAGLIGQVLAHRLAHFGYVPGQSYLLIGAIVFNIILIYVSDKIASLIYKN